MSVSGGDASLHAAGFQPMRNEAAIPGTAAWA
ncbi:hypothetical protein DM77_2074 [Burkholderia mallei]|nr:hypothetical protein DM77_2074 [Burkholderia mallei]